MFQPTLEREATTRSELLPLARAGYAWKDATDPGWQGRIDLDDFNMGFCNTCALGQTEPELNYNKTVQRLGWNAERQVRLGFYIDEPNKRIRAWKYRILTEIWEDLIFGIAAPEALPDYRKAPAGARTRELELA